MHVTARVDNALRVMLTLGQADSHAVPVTELADAFGVSYSYLLAIVKDLRRAGLVHHTRGSDGGVQLARPPTDISLDQIIWAADGPLTISDGTQQIDAEPPDSSVGYFRTLWSAAHRAMLEVFSQVRLADAISQQLPTTVARRPKAS